MSNTKPRILRNVTGTLYPNVEAGSGPRDRRLPHPSADRKHYVHPVVKVNERDVEQWDHLKRTPLWVEHAQGQQKPIQVGEVIEGRVVKDDSLFIAASIYDIPEGEWAAQQIENGTITGFSIGYDPIANDRGELVGKHLKEVSLVVKPFFPNTLISVCASDSNNYKTNDGKDLFQIFVPITMSDANTNANANPVTTPVQQQQQQSTPVAQAPPAQPKVDAATEIRNNVAEMELKVLQEQRRKDLEQTEQLRKEREALDNELKAYREQERLAKEAEKESKVKELDAALANIQKTLGVKELPKEYVEGNHTLVKKSVDLHRDDPTRKTVEVMASFTKQLGNAAAAAVDERDKLRAELEALKAQMAQKEKEFSSTAERVRASRTSLYGGDAAAAAQTTTTSTTKVEVKASGAAAGSDIVDLLVVPRVKAGTREGQIYREQYQPSQAFVSYGINASGTAAEDPMVYVKPLPKHNHLEHCAGSIRYRTDADGNPSGEAWLSHIVHNYNKDAPTSAKFQMTQNQTTVERRF